MTPIKRINTDKTKMKKTRQKLTANSKRPKVKSVPISPIRVIRVPRNTVFHQISVPKVFQLCTNFIRLLHVKRIFINSHSLLNPEPNYGTHVAELYSDIER